ncbi:hypothetical protein ACE1AT_04745 [Pelatocladus sp. BLCC-F211]|uniref:hypothetical protein n=1 Tax=Pelatocladus sp. BLCC-F211 TaxID=3342752 RepID=UPI0035B72F28
MTPKELRNKWNLTNYQLACCIGKTEQTVKQYMAQPGSKSHRNPPLSIKILCTELDRKWQQQGMPNIPFLAA